MSCIVLHGQQFTLEEGRVWSTDVDQFVLEILENWRMAKPV